jgi:putative holliday junction resolvase
MTQSNNPKTSHYLGIDYGKARIGLAIADSETKIAFALKTLENNKDFLGKLVQIIQENNIIKVIIGIPAYTNHEETEYDSDPVKFTEKKGFFSVNHGARKFGKLLKKELKIEIEYQNEMFTTKMAHQNLIDKGARNIKSQDDREAARIILQSWLDKH